MNGNFLDIFFEHLRDKNKSINAFERMFLIRNKIINKIEKVSFNRYYVKTIPINHNVDDIFLVSYPKSGNHWLRFLIANSIRVKYNIEREVNFFSIQDIIPDIHVYRHIPQKGCFNVSEIPRIIKSHAAYNPYYKRVVLLVRDPRDVMVSYYYYLRSFGDIPTSMTMTEFIKNKQFGIQSWKKHTQSWISQSPQGHIIKIFRYEDFKSNTTEELYKLMKTIGIEMSLEQLSKAIDLSSKDRMSKSESEHRSNYRLKIQETPVVREAKVAKGKSLSDESRNIIENDVRDITEFLDYS